MRQDTDPDRVDYRGSDPGFFSWQSYPGFFSWQSYPDFFLDIGFVNGKNPSGSTTLAPRRGIRRTLLRESRYFM